jgi:hypothetical protein
MAIETTVVDVPQLRIGVRFAIAAALFLAAIAVFIAVTFDPPASVGVTEAGQASVVDYALRHTLAVAQPTDYGFHDYALRHGAFASVAVTPNSADYALRHPTGAPDLGYSNSPDYALRHLEG